MTAFLTLSSLSRHPGARRRAILFAGALLLLAGLWYAAAANSVVSTSYRYYDRLTEKQSIAQEVEALRVKTATALSPETLETKAGTLGFSPIMKPVYLSIPGTIVAQR